MALPPLPRFCTNSLNSTHLLQSIVANSTLLALANGPLDQLKPDFLGWSRLEIFLAGPVQPLPIEDADAELAGAIRADLESVGKPISAYDLLIAGQAMRNKLTLITANLSEFARIKALAWANWGKP